MKTYCHACHNNVVSKHDRIAPPMIAIKRRYMFSSASKEEFIRGMKFWISNTAENNSKMKEAVNCFGVMQKLP